MAFAHPLQQHVQRVKGEPATLERDVCRRAQDQIRSGGRERFAARFEVMRQPEIVMAQVSNQRRPRQGAPDIVRRALLAPVALEVNEPHPRIRLDVSRDNLGGVIGARVSDDNQLPIRERLPENALDRMGQRAAAIVGRDHYRNRGRCHGQMKH